MEKKIPCEVIRDLMPLYVDKLTSQVTGQEIEAHMAVCEACRECCRRLRAGIEKQEEERKRESEREVDYLKKVKSKSNKKLFLGIAAVLLLVLAAAGCKLFLLGSPYEEYVVLYTNVYEDRIEVAGDIFESSALVYCRHQLKENEDGTTRLVIYAGLPSFLHRSGCFSVTVPLEEMGTAVDVGGITVKRDGTVISEKANDLFVARNPYVGDISADGKLVQALELAKELGNATTELQTEKEPYGWTFHFIDSVKNSASFEEKMKNYGCVLIALTDNLSEVHWTYTVELAEGPVERHGSITEQECSVLVGSPVKSFAESPEKVQELLVLLGIR